MLTNHCKQCVKYEIEIERLRSLGNEMLEQLQLMNYEEKAKETYDAFVKELKTKHGVKD